MNVNTKTYYVAQNISTLEHVRKNLPLAPKFNDTTIDDVQAAWDNNTKMRCLNSPQLYVQKSTIGEARVCFVGKHFYLYTQFPPSILNNKGVRIGERRSNLIETHT